MAGDDYDQGVFAMAVAPDGDLLICSLTQFYEWPAASPVISTEPDMVLDGFKGLYGIAVHPDGRVFLADSGHNQLFVAVENPQDDTWSKQVFAGSGATYPVNERNVFDGVGTAASFDQPSGLALDAARNVLYVSDSAANLVRVVDLTTKNVTTLAGNVTSAKAHTALPGPNAGFNDGTGLAVRFQAPLDLTLDAAGNVFLLDELGTNPNLPSTGGGVRLLSGQNVYTVAGSPDHGAINGPGAAARFTYFSVCRIISSIELRFHTPGSRKTSLSQ
jgi:DNA-binding beta-propeller fold protein YncE